MSREQALRELIAKWRRLAEPYIATQTSEQHPIRCDLQVCADELEAALAAEPGAGAQRFGLNQGTSAEELAGPKWPAPAVKELSERGIHIDRDCPTNGWLIERGADGFFTALEYGRIERLKALLRSGGECVLGVGE